LTFEIRPDSDALSVSPFTLLISPSRYCAGVRVREAMSFTSSRFASEYGVERGDGEVAERRLRDVGRHHAVSAELDRVRVAVVVLVRERLRPLLRVDAELLSLHPVEQRLVDAVLDVGDVVELGDAATQQARIVRSPRSSRPRRAGSAAGRSAARRHLALDPTADLAAALRTSGPELVDPVIRGSCRVAWISPVQSSSHTFKAAARTRRLVPGCVLDDGLRGVLDPDVRSARVVGFGATWK
jgi:hypothetical protein